MLPRRRDREAVAALGSRFVGPCRSTSASEDSPSGSFFGLLGCQLRVAGLKRSVADMCEASPEDRVQDGCLSCGLQIGVEVKHLAESLEQAWRIFEFREVVLISFSQWQRWPANGASL